MPDATELATLADIKTLLGLTTSNEEALLTIVKNNVEAWVKTFCGRDFIVATFTEYHDGDGSSMVRVDQRPILSITSIHSDPALLFEDASLIPSTDYVTDPRGRELGFIELNQYKFLKGRKATKVVYSAGYSTIPYDLSMAVKLIVCKQYKVISKKMFAEQTQQAGDMVVTLTPDTFPKDAMDILKAYRRMAF